MKPERILIIGGPRVGKTTLATQLGEKLGMPVLSTDSLIGLLAWSDASAEVARWLDRESFLIEGITVVRAIRKWLAANEAGLPCDVLYVGETPRVERTQGQITMAKAFRTIWSEVAPELERRGLRPETF